ncbi:hypothetical protein [[Kitasatospora] papulosa]|uniref:hypothetical protein n=1 Tax=[Kitasatospora] papulosa TaxID=1464011 RepID=UPI0036D0203B
MALLELGELGVGSGEFADEPLFEITQPCDAGLTWVGLLASSPCGSRLRRSRTSSFLIM